MIKIDRRKWLPRAATSRTSGCAMRSTSRSQDSSPREIHHRYLRTHPSSVGSTVGVPKGSGSQRDGLVSEGPFHDQVAPSDHVPAGEDFDGRRPALDIDDDAVAQYLHRKVIPHSPVEDQLLSDLEALVSTDIDQGPLVAADLLEIAWR